MKVIVQVHKQCSDMLAIACSEDISEALRKWGAKMVKTYLVFEEVETLEYSESKISELWVKHGSNPRYYFGNRYKGIVSIQRGEQIGYCFVVDKVTPKMLEQLKSRPNTKFVETSAMRALQDEYVSF